MEHIRSNESSVTAKSWPQKLSTNHGKLRFSLIHTSYAAIPRRPRHTPGPSSRVWMMNSHEFTWYIMIYHDISWYIIYCNHGVMFLKTQLQPSCHAWWQWPGWDMFEDDIGGPKHPGPCISIGPSRKMSNEKKRTVTVSRHLMIITWNDRSKLAISWTTRRIIIILHD